MICEATAKKYCKDFIKIENYEEAIVDSDKWDCHHRLELDGPIPLSSAELIGLELYYDRPPEELIFLRHSEHSRLHNKGKTPWNKGKNGIGGYKLSEETKNKMSVAHKGKPSPNKGKIFSEEWKQKLSESSKGRNKGKHWKIIDGKRIYY